MVYLGHFLVSIGLAKIFVWVSPLQNPNELIGQPNIMVVQLDLKNIHDYCISTKERERSRDGRTCVNITHLLYPFFISFLPVLKAKAIFIQNQKKNVESGKTFQPVIHLFNNTYLLNIYEMPDNMLEIHKQYQVVH